MKESRRKSLADRIHESKSDIQASLEKTAQVLTENAAQAVGPDSSVQKESEPALASTPPPVRLERPLSSGNGLVRRAYQYAEIHRLREKIVSSLLEKGQKVVLATGPHDNAGTSTIMALLAYNAAFYTGMNVLLADLNMRNPNLHKHFGLQMEYGFRETAAGLVDWKNTVKDTDLPRLKLITAGHYDGELYPFLNRSFLEKWLDELKGAFDLLFLDTSPVLLENRNNVDPVLLSLLGDMTILVVQDKKTRIRDLEEMVKSITEGDGKIEGVVYNQQFQGILRPLRWGSAR